ncbi:DUF4363 family protein [Alkaliphilus pronyensis]|uniref:DUF4363 family protein n=1 Tax=Alkaliphilus pronyensis TaxID=1482732 RepID=A0A6I0EYS3_9FIRM|nr:DUF4363 family protein [Alkaliphilus pronyensis]KAB3534090.1 DUF4363 family protein [Alkaliphilus pronyensis]
MKTVYTTLTILIVFFIGAIYFLQYVEYSCNEILTHIERLDECILNEDWDKTHSNIEALKKEWRQKKRVWEILLEHYDIDTIDVAISKIEKFADINNKDLALGELVKLKFYIKHIEDKEAFSIANLL